MNIHGGPNVVPVEASITRAHLYGSSAGSLAALSPGAQPRSRPVLVALAGVILIAGAALLNYTLKARDILTSDEGQWRPPADESPTGDGALFVHKKLMEVRTTDSGVPVLRFVECRHYTKEHHKLIQTGFTRSGQPILRFVPGDYCILAGAEVGAPDPAAVQLHAESLVKLHVPVGIMSALSLQRDWGAHLFGRSISYYQQYTCEKFGPACRVALAIQSAENGKGDCQAYHYNSDGSLDWGYFQINSVHLTRRGVNLRDLLDCKANIDFAFQLYKEEGFQPWTTYVSGAYRKFLDDALPHSMDDPQLRRPERILKADLF